MRVALMVTCINDALYPRTGQAVVTLLRRLGVDVEFPEAQTCCAQPMVNTGYLDEAVPVVRTFVDAFEGYDAVVTPSGSCAGSARHQHSIVARRSGDARLVAAVAETAPKVYELSEFLVDVLGVSDVGAYYPHTVTYHPTCHSLRMLGVGDRPRKLLEQVRGLTLVDLPAAEQCCGFGGTFAVKNADTSVAMGADKVRHVRETGAEVLVAGDNSCLTHIGGLMARQRSGVRAVHLAEILASTEDSAGRAASASAPAGRAASAGPPAGRAASAGPPVGRAASASERVETKGDGLDTASPSGSTGSTTGQAGRAASASPAAGRAASASERVETRGDGLDTASPSGSTGSTTKEDTGSAGSTTGQAGRAASAGPPAGRAASASERVETEGGLQTEGPR